jgi:hypothetical protein
MVKSQGRRNVNTTVVRGVVDFPASAKLGLNEDELNEIAFQGFVCQEKRRDRVYHKLRFRIGGKQRVRYIGDAEAARKVGEELSVLQEHLRHFRHVAALRRVVREQLQASKQALEPYLKARGLYYHGQSIRKRRASQ